MATGKYDFVVVRNRTAAPVSVTFDGQEELWAPHEERSMLVSVAQHCVHHSTVTWDQYTDQRVTRLCVVRPGEGTPEDLDPEVLASPSSVPLDRMEVKYAQDGTPLTPKVMDISNQAMARKGRGFQVAEKTGERLAPKPADPVLETADAQIAEALAADAPAQ